MTAESIRTIRRALDLGITFIDTRGIRPYRNEELVGRAIAGRRDQVVCWQPSSGWSPTATEISQRATARRRTSA